MQTPPLPEQTENPPALWPRKARSALIAGVLLWVVPMLVIGVMVALRPTHRTVTLDSYHMAAGNWWLGKSLYAGPQGMNYLPHFAVLFSPFHFVPLWLGEVLWRFCAAATLAGGLWWLMRALFRSAPERPFFWATLVAMPLCMTSLRNGNANALFGGVTLLANQAAGDFRLPGPGAVGQRAPARRQRPPQATVDGVYVPTVVREIHEAVRGVAVLHGYIVTSELPLALFQPCNHVTL